MADTAHFTGAHTGWEWAFVSDVTNQEEKERELADPNSWTRLDSSQEAMAGFWPGLEEGPNESENILIIWTEYDHFEYICRWPVPSEHGLWEFHVKIIPYRPCRRWPKIGPYPRVLVRAIPAARLLAASLSETPSAIGIVFRSLTGDQVGEATRSKDEGHFLMVDLVELAEQVAEQENLLSSVNQKLCVLLDGCHHQLPPTAILWSAAANQERGFRHL